jgi:hypothetical protein
VPYRTMHATLEISPVFAFCACLALDCDLLKTTWDPDAGLDDAVQHADADRRFQRRAGMAAGTVKFFNFSQRALASYIHRMVGKMYSSTFPWSNAPA